ncbi:MAG TPA: acyltransferase [Chryseosolibacter sp.]
MTNERKYFENLDGLRFLCFLSVFFYHSFDTQFAAIRNSSIHKFVREDLFENGNLGVNFFFVLSGFLITHQLIQEKKNNGQIDLANFWVRRILRIWPLYYLSVFFGFIIFPALKVLFGQVPQENASLSSYLLFINNFDVLEKGTPDAAILGSLWSIAVEEQFYLIWPILLFLMPARLYWFTFAAVLFTTWVFRADTDDPTIFHFHTLSCMGDMAVGATGAWLMAYSSGFRDRIINIDRFQVILLYLVLAIVFLFRKELLFQYYWTRIFERSFIAAIMLLVVLEQCYASRPLVRMGRFKILSGLGVISYGLYSFHFIGILIAKTLTDTVGFNQSVWQVIFLETSLALLFTIVLAEVSFVFFEQPILSLKQRISPSQGASQNVAAKTVNTSEFFVFNLIILLRRAAGKERIRS